jgi:hypothetical protein
MDCLAYRPALVCSPPLCASLQPSVQEGRRQRTNPVQGSAQPSATVSSAQSKYTPAGVSAAVYQNSGQGISSPNSAATGSVGVATGSGGQASLSKNSGLSKSLWIVFGVEGPESTPEVDQVGKGDIQSDRLFVKELRSRHRQLRGWVRLYLSFWRLNHWEYVKVSSTIM